MSKRKNYLITFITENGTEEKIPFTGTPAERDERMKEIINSKYVVQARFEVGNNSNSSKER